MVTTSRFSGLPRRLVIDQAQLERRFRDLSRQFHPDYFYNASPAERLASLERSSYLNDAYRALRNPISRIEHLLAIEGLPSAKSEDGTAKVPPGLLEEVFELNEQLDEIRESRESGGDPAALRERLESARKPIDLKREEHEREVEALSAQWDQQLATASPAEDARRSTRCASGCWSGTTSTTCWPPSTEVAVWLRPVQTPAEPSQEPRAEAWVKS